MGNSEYKTSKSLWILHRSISDDRLNISDMLFVYSGNNILVNVPNVDAHGLLQVLESINVSLGDDNRLPNITLKEINLKELFVDNGYIMADIKSVFISIVLNLIWILEYHLHTRYSSIHSRALKPYIRLANILSDSL